jgi:pyridoxal phosphate enzyme (YggS family)
MTGIQENIDIVRAKIAAAAQRSGRNPLDITLLAVSKKVDPERIQNAINAGILDFGENYYQEAREKLPLFKDTIRWHFIGHLQTNKAKYIAGNFALVHSVDTIDLAKELSKRALLRQLRQPILAEVLLDPSGSKFGMDVDKTLRLCEDIAMLEGVELLGLMGMPPMVENPEEIRPVFRQMRHLFDHLPEENRKILSMGMSGDFEAAIEEGSTLVRVGTAIFGHRM